MIKVMIYGQNVGYLSEINNKVEFSYDRDFLNSGLELSPLLLPLQEGIFSPTPFRDTTFKGLPHFIADALPDHFGNRLIDSFFAKKGISPANVSVLDRLSYVGNKAIGALEFEPMHVTKASTQHVLEIKKIIADARKAIRGEIDEVSADFIHIGSSAGGARPKALIAINHNTNEIVAGNEQIPAGFEHYLIKFDGINSADHTVAPDTLGGYTNIEYAYYLMAVKCGLTMQSCSQLHEGNALHFLTSRFDRNHNKKTHVQTLCGMTGIDYNQLQIASYSDFFTTVKNLELSYESRQQAFKRMVFNVVTVNHDDHTKNFSFTMEQDGRWALAPAYDLTFNFGKNANSWTKEHCLLINGKGIHFTKEDLIKESEGLDLSRNERMEIIESIVEIVSQEWGIFAKQSRVHQLKIERIEKEINQAVKQLRRGFSM